MQRPTVQAPLSQPGMNAAGDLYRDPSDAMTATGGPSVAYPGWEPGPQASDTGRPDPLPVNYPPRLGEVANPHDGGFDRSRWTDADDIPSGGPWTETP